MRWPLSIRTASGRPQPHKTDQIILVWPGRQRRPEPGTHRCGRPTPSSGCGRETRTRADLEIPALVVSRRMPRRSQLTVGDDEEDDDDEEDGDDEEDDGEGQGCKR